MASDGLFWLVSYPKSGNTWVRIFLHNYLSKLEGPININDDLNQIAISSNRILFDMLVGVESSNLTKDEIDVLRTKYYEYYAKSESVPHLDTIKILKVHDAYVRNCKGEFIFPLSATKGIIYIVRNPYDVVISMANHFDVTVDKAVEYMTSSDFSLANSDDRLVKQFRQQILDWREHFYSWNNLTSVPKILFKYEELLEDPEHNFAALIDFLSVQLDEDKLRKALEFSSFNIVRSQEESLGFSEVASPGKKFFSFGTSGHGKKLLSNQQIQKMQDAFLTHMRILGYEV